VLRRWWRWPLQTSPRRLTQILTLRQFPELAGQEVKRAPASYGVSLPLVYVIWIALVVVLYYPCHWFAGVKKRYRWAWLSYL